MGILRILFRILMVVCIKETISDFLDKIIYIGQRRSIFFENVYKRWNYQVFISYGVPTNYKNNLQNLANLQCFCPIFSIVLHSFWDKYIKNFEKWALVSNWSNLGSEKMPGDDFVPLFWPKKYSQTKKKKLHCKIHFSRNLKWMKKEICPNNKNQKKTKLCKFYYIRVVFFPMRNQPKLKVKYKCIKMSFDL